jgi:RNA polymerase sigma factor (sigma-70 family)
MSRLLSTVLVRLRDAAGAGADRVTDADLLGRFVRQRDAAAFELLFWRHGPLVWGVCRRLLGDSPDAEDAFQAVFVVLAQKAGTVARPEALAGFLHRVAWRTALNARTARRRRSAHEQPMRDLSELPGRDNPVRRTQEREFKDLLDQELLKLPEKYRQPILLCDMEARTNEEAAAVLDCPVGTLNSRLARGRQRLRSRLVRRGVALTTLAVVAAPASVSAAALGAVLHTPSASVQALADGAIHALTTSTLKKLAVFMLLGMLVAGLACAAFAAREGPRPAASAPSGGPSARPAAADLPHQAVILGKVVDEAGKPVAGATVTAVGEKKSLPVKSAADGAFRLPLGSSADDGLYATLLVQGTGGQLGYLAVYQQKPAPVQVVLKAPHPLVVRVTDGAGKPVSGAPVYFLGNMRRLAGGRTGAEGRWSGSVPADARDWSVFAHKGKVGFDYASGRPALRAGKEPGPVPGQVRLTLDGARTLRIKTVDRQGKPIPGVKVGPWYIHKPGREEDVNLSGTSDLWPATGADGAATLDWLPARTAHGLSILAHCEDHYPPDHATIIPQDRPTDELTITLLPLERLSGRVTHADGRPAAGIRVRANGQGAGHNRFHRTTRTGADGRYSLKVYSEQAYIVAVTEERVAAPYRGGIVVRAGKPVAGVDFVLGPVTGLHGRVTVGKAGRPAPPQTGLWVDIDLGEIPVELRKKGDRTYWNVRMSFPAWTDRDGRYEFHLGPGQYKLRGPARTGTVEVTIPTEKPPTQIVRDFRMPRQETGPLAGLVVDADGRPVAGAVVDGRYAAETGKWFRPLKTDAGGRFNVVRSLDPFVLYARTSDGKRAGVTRIDAESARVEIRVSPVARASGRLLDLGGKALAQKKLQYGIRIYLGKMEESPFSDCFGGNAVTDAQGRFTLTGLIPGQTYEVNLKLDEHSSRTVTQVFPKNTRPIDLGDLRADPKPAKPYVPPTPAQRTANAFAPGQPTSPQQRRDKVLAEARREYTRPLLLFGQPKDPACIDLFRLFNEEPEPDKDGARKKRSPSPSELRWEFELASLDTDQADVLALAAKLGVPAGKGRPPVLAGLNADGTLAVTHALALDKQQKLDREALAAFLVKHKLPTRDAEKMLAEALQKAKAGNRRVFIITSASWCGPCRLLSRFLASWKKELEDHYVFVKLDISRDEHADAVRKRFQGDSDGGVPWYAILDADGMVLITSNAPALKRRGKAMNIGFPSSTEGIEHFVKMLEQTAPRLTKDQLAQVRKALAARK